MKGYFENSMSLTRFMLRRERIISSVWIASILFVVVGLVPAMREVLDAESRAALFAMIENPSLVAMMGPAYTLVNENFGGLYTTMMLLLSALTTGLMSILLVIRHTRADEEKWRYEVVRSLPVGRLANLNAALITAAVVNILLSAAVGFGMYLLGDESMSFNGSMIWGACLGVTGLVFAAVAALFSQLSSSSRSALGYSFAALALLFLLRAPGDMEIRVVSGEVVTGNMETLSLISPLGLILRTKPYVGDHWQPVLILLGVAIVFAAAAFYLNSIRDIDQGMIPARRGRAEGSSLMSSPFGLSFKLLRTALIVWVLGMFTLGAAYGAVAGEVDQFMVSNDVWQQLMIGPAGIEMMNDAGYTPEQTLEFIRVAVAEEGYTLTELYMSTITNIMGVFTIVPLLIFMLRVKSEEKDIRAELVMSAPVSRAKYLMGYAAIAFASAVVLQIVQAVGLYSVGISVLESPGELSMQFLLKANLIYVPAQWLMLGAVIFLIGILPKAAGLAWGFFTLAFLLVLFGRMDIFPEWTQKLTPFGHVPQLPMEEINFFTLGVLIAIGAILTATGFFFYRKRDINAITH